jgi:uncharacterized protein (UPF0335 family)
MAKNPDVGGGDNSATVAGAQLRSFFERIERLSEEKAAIATDIREVFAEAKGNGFDTKIMRIILKRRAADRAELAEQDALVHTYSKALGMDSPADAEDDE